MNRRRVAAIAVLASLALLGAACEKDKPAASGNDKPATSKSAAPAIAIPTKAKDLKVGLIVSSSGPGADVKDLAAGAYVAAFRLNGATAGHDNVSLMVADDNGTTDGAVAAMQQLVDDGAAGVVYASTGEQVLAGVAKAAELGMPVVLPYADDPRVTETGTTSYLTGPTIPQVAEELAAHVEDDGIKKVALVRQAGAYGEAGKAALAAAGMEFVSDTPYATGSTLDAKGIVGSAPDAVIVWAESAPAVAIADALAAAGSGAQMLFANRSAMPAFGQLVAGSLASSVGDGALSVGSWAGADTPGDAVDVFFVAKDKAVSDGGVTADLGVADLRSHDAVLALVAAAVAAGEEANSVGRAETLDALRTLSAVDVAGMAGAPLDFGSPTALTDDNVALLSYSTLDDGSGRYPAMDTAGGHWIAVSGSFELPEALDGLDNPYGG